MRYVAANGRHFLRAGTRLCDHLRWSRLQSTTSGDASEEKPIDPSGPGDGDLGRLINDDFSTFKQKYRSPKYPIVLAHGLMGFDELHLAGRFLSGVQYWRGIKEVLNANDIEVITTSVPATGAIEARARALEQEITTKAAGKDVNIIAHSMGGLDARCLISQLKPKAFKVMSLTTIATPHRGSSAADIIFREIGQEHLPGIYKLLSRLHIESGAFSQLTRAYLRDEFNPANPDDPAVRYFSYGASARPSLFSVFRVSHDLIEELEGPNDGLVSVASSKWGKDGYKGTLMGVTHLDLINWTNRLKLLVAHVTRQKRNFVASAFYLSIADMLAREGL
jgi:triacylglycerol lipase